MSSPDEPLREICTIKLSKSSTEGPAIPCDGCGLVIPGVNDVTTEGRLIARLCSTCCSEFLNQTARMIRDATQEIRDRF